MSTSFGLGIAPLEFTDLVKKFKKIAVELGFSINQYLDDCINLAFSRNECMTSTVRLLALSMYLCFIPNLEYPNFQFRGHPLHLTT